MSILLFFFFFFFFFFFVKNGELNLYLSLKKRFSVTSDGLVFWRKEKAAKQNVFSTRLLLDARDIEHAI